MTTIEKIKSLTWWNEISKLKDILTSLFTNTENIDTRVTNIENNPPTPQVLQNLQSVLDTGNTSSKESNYFNMFAGSPNDRFAYIGMDNAVSGVGKNVTEFVIRNSNAYLINTKGTDSGARICVDSGEVYLTKTKTNFVVDFAITDPTINNTHFLIPAKTTAGNYTVNTTPNVTYIVSTLPSGVLNDMAIVTDATAPTYLGTLVGGGAVVCPVWHNGTIWVSR